MAECVEWTGYRYRNGYGGVRIKRDGKWSNTTAHRKAWIDAYGEIPDDYHVHHLCGNPACVNLEHLKSVPKVDHHRTHCQERESWRKLARSKIDKRKAAEIRARKRKGETAKAIAVEYGISEGHVRTLMTGRCW